MQLTDSKIRDIDTSLSQGKPLPDQYRFLLSADKREVELVWNGKTNEVTNVVLPFQVIEQVDEPRTEKPEGTKMQLELFGFYMRGRQIKGWTNKLIWGDNKLVLSSLKNGPLREEIEEQAGSKPIYIDPPFGVGADFSMDIEVGVETLTKEPSVLEMLAHRLYDEKKHTIKDICRMSGISKPSLSAYLEQRPNSGNKIMAANT
jgi:hypothetical protein